MPPLDPAATRAVGAWGDQAPVLALCLLAFVVLVVLAGMALRLMVQNFTRALERVTEQHEVARASAASAHARERSETRAEYLASIQQVTAAGAAQAQACHETQREAAAAQRDVTSALRSLESVTSGLREDLREARFARTHTPIPSSRHGG